MFVSVKNNSPAKQGVHTLDGVRWIKPGATVSIEIDELRQLERLPFLEITHLTEDGVPVGDLPAPPASLLDKVRGHEAWDPRDKAAAGLRAVAIQGSAAETVAAADRLRALDHDRDGKAGGSTSAVEDIKTLRAAYEVKLGKRPFPGWNAEELRRRMAAA